MWQDILNFLSNVGHLIMNFISPLAQSIAANGGPVLVQAAESAVAAAEATGGNGDAKRAAAVAAVVSTLTKQGLPVVMNAVNGAIESAVAQLQANQPASTAAPASP